MLHKRPEFARLDEVLITRKSDYADIEFRDRSVGKTQLEIGPDVWRMTDAEILEVFNDVVLGMGRAKAEYKYVAIEIPAGSPQIHYSPLSDQWVPCGDVLRCEIEDSGPGGEVVVVIDDQHLSLEEFGRLLITCTGGGMRIVFVPDDELEVTPKIVVQEPNT